MTNTAHGTPGTVGASPADVSFADVIRARQNVTKHPGDADARKAYGETLATFKAECAGPNPQVGVFGTGGVFISGNGEFHYVTNGSERHFDALEAENVIYRVNDIAERAKDWWRADQSVVWWEKDSVSVSLWHPIKRHGRRRRRRRERARAAEREPHLALAYSIATATYAAIAEENAQRPRPMPTGGLVRVVARLRHELGHPVTLTEVDRAPSGAFLRNVAALRERVGYAEKLFLAAAQRDAQSLYAKGMLFGMLAIAVAYGVVWLLLDSSDVSQATAIAFPCGAVGALVSVLQRMTAGKLELDFTAGTRMLVWLGAGRPWIGGILGMTLYAFVRAGLLPVVPADSVPLAFFAAGGFVAGFNERFAQDMIAGSALSPKGEAQ